MCSERMNEVFRTVSYSRTTGVKNWNAHQSGVPGEDGKPLNGTAGFGYASFLLGYPNTINAALVTNVRLGNHSLAGYFQDSWKVTRKLTLGYGLRYDFVTLLKEQYGRMQSADFKKPNPLVNHLPVSAIYEAP